jgi:hypothetical protein
MASKINKNVSIDISATKLKILHNMCAWPQFGSQNGFLQPGKGIHSLKFHEFLALIIHLQFGKPIWNTK